MKQANQAIKADNFPVGLELSTKALAMVEAIQAESPEAAFDFELDQQIFQVGASQSLQHACSNR
jgi:hypothetical protein